MILINNLKDKRSKISVTNKSNLSVRLIDLTHNNNTVTILFIYSSSLINLEQKQEEYSAGVNYITLLRVASGEWRVASGKFFFLWFSLSPLLNLSQLMHKTV